MPRSYIGITGFMSREEVEGLVPILLDNSSHDLMAGVLVSEKTLSGVPNKYPNRYPKVGEIANIFLKHPQIVNMVHFHTDTSIDLCNKLLRIMLLADESLCDGFQLNMVWPDPRELEKFKGFFPKKKIVLQLSKAILDHDPNQVFSRFLLDYEGLVDYVLLDGSGGHGVEIDSAFLLQYVNLFRSLHPTVNIVAAGGLWSINLGLLSPLLEAYPALSIDSEGMLRDGNDRLSLIKARNYLREATITLE